MGALGAAALFPFLGTPLWFWAIFFIVITGLMFLDLGLFNRKDHVIGTRESLLLSAFYISVGLCFAVFIWSTEGSTPAIEFTTGLLIEKSLSLDNIFVISLIFGTLGIPPLYQHRVLVWGIIGVIILRGILIGVGTALVAEFHWILWFFGAFLIFTAIRMLFSEEMASDPTDSRLLRFFQRHMPISERLDGHKFIVRDRDQTGRLRYFATPLLLALFMVETADLIFAVDSIPAIFAITTDPFIVFTSNIFAVLGLRALYFALAAVIRRFAYLKTALAIVLLFIGGKIFWNDLFGKIDPLISLGATLAILASGIIYSLWRSRNEKAET